MANSVVFKVALVLVACMLVTAPYAAEGAISCGQVVSSLRSCVPYLQGKGPLPPSCCAGVRSVNNAAKTTPDRQAACGCLKSAASSFRVIPGLASGLPGKCGVNIGFSISPNVDCSKVR
ncbi:Non-specific lipid-transfer protein [Thalictrum thalictroides]|uniref:Non-specific lipid-transfer protein n=1 Tax=Thalictrum thalictroides TaxID=46969 RepID=A0A7J6WHM3_THATH|nr:Non-specific lipid-transfer protein [Thalictrum thalictroides]